MIHWSPTKLKFTLGIGSLASIALLSELSQKAIPTWLAVGIVMLPLAVFVFADPDDIPHSIARSLQIGASLWYLAVNSVLAVMFVMGGLKVGWLIALIFLAVGAIPCLIVLGRAELPASTEEGKREDTTALPWDGNVEPIDVSRAVVYRPRMGRRLLMLLICSAFVVGGVLMIHEGKAFGWFAVAFFGLGVVVFILQLLPNCSYLRVSSNGLEMRSLWRTHRYQWVDISHFYAGSIGPNKMVLMAFAPTYHHAQIGRTVARCLRKNNLNKFHLCGDRV